MAFLISDLDAQYAPLEGESLILLSLRRLPSGFALKAVTPEGRDVGRWVSDCPLTASLSAMLWLGQNRWKIKQSKDSLPISKIIEDVPGIAPRGAHPQQAIDVLRTNFPPKPNESAATGAQIDLDDPEELSLTRRGGSSLAITGPVAEPAASTVLAPVTLAPAAPVAPVAPAAPQVDHGGVDPVGLDRLLRGAVGKLKAAIRANGNTSEPIDELLVGLGVEEAARPNYKGIDLPTAARITNALIGEIKRLGAGESAILLYRDVLHGLGVRLSEDGAATDIEDELAEVDELIAAVEAGPRYRVLQPGEIPPGLTPDQVAELEARTIDDPAAREKVQRSLARAQHEHDRINRALAARAAAAAQQPAAVAPRPALSAPPLTVPPSPVSVAVRRQAPAATPVALAPVALAPVAPAAEAEASVNGGGSSGLVRPALEIEEEEGQASDGESNGLGES